MPALKYIQTIALLFCLNISIHAQLEPCGTIAEAYHNYAKFKRNDFVKVRSNFILPVKLHIITDPKEKNDINLIDIINEFNLSASYYHTVNIDLQLCGINYIENSKLYHFDQSDGFSSINSYNEAYVINMYIVKTLVNPLGSSLCGLAFLPWTPYNLIIINSACASNGSTIAHEIGHSLGLYHTHETSFGVELVDQSNCENTGDLICDTPADPTLSTTNVNSSCLYTGTKKDTNGNTYRPNPEIIMSYSRKDCRNIFTAEQGTVMRNICDSYYSGYHCKDLSLDSKIIVFPNPTTEFLNIVMFGKVDFKASLYDMKGLLVKKWQNETQISLNALPQGIYILEILDNELDQKTFKKVMVSK